jgi:DNA-binding CsgD family transcriptional regulator
MENDELKAASDGFILFDPSMMPIFVNRAAVQILAYPDKPEAKKDVEGYLAGKIRSKLASEYPSNGTSFIVSFQSGRRTYSCRGFPVNGMSKGDSPPCFAAILERASARPTLAHVFERFHLTTREQQVAQFLLQGLTSKEIGVRMQISPNTVKVFLHLIMIKMGVSTRSGIVGKVLTQNCGPRMTTLRTLDQSDQPLPTPLL